MSPELLEILPKEKQVVMELVRQAGVDVGGWAQFEGGPKKAASNPKYCYEWSFVEPNKVVVLNLWYESMQQNEGIISQSFNYRDIVKQYDGVRGKGVWVKRAKKVDEAIKIAIEKKLPIKAIICEGSRRGVDVPNTEASRVRKRFLDPVEWIITSYDWSSGDCTVKRGRQPDDFADQFSLSEELQSTAGRREVSGYSFIRDAEIRKRVLLRANGRCEWCGQRGFLMQNGKLFLETHHIVPLSKDGDDNEKNVVALCPNHHREAHYGTNAEGMRAELEARFSI